MTTKREIRMVKKQATVFWERCGAMRVYTEVNGWDEAWLKNSTIEPDDPEHCSPEAIITRLSAETRWPASTWLAIAKCESGFQPGIVGGPNRNGTYDYGLLQHNGQYLAGRLALRGYPWSMWSDATASMEMAIDMANATDSIHWWTCARLRGLS